MVTKNVLTLSYTVAKSAQKYNSSHGMSLFPEESSDGGGCFLLLRVEDKLRNMYTVPSSTKLNKRSIKLNEDQKRSTRLTTVGQTGPYP